VQPFSARGNQDDEEINEGELQLTYVQSSASVRSRGDGGPLGLTSLGILLRTS